MRTSFGFAVAAAVAASRSVDVVVAVVVVVGGVSVVVVSVVVVAVAVVAGVDACSAEDGSLVDVSLSHLLVDTLSMSTEAALSCPFVNFGMRPLLRRVVTPVVFVAFVVAEFELVAAVLPFIVFPAVAGIEFRFGLPLLLFSGCGCSAGVSCVELVGVSAREALLRFC